MLQSPKATILRGIVQKQFRDNKDEANQEKLHKMKQAWVLLTVCGVLYAC